MRLFITGASGLIGSALCAEAIRRDHQVLGMQRTPGVILPRGCESITADLADPPWHQIEEFKPDAALHLAWTTRPGINFHSPENESLVVQTDGLFRGLAARGVRQLAGTGTFIEYAPSTDPLVEDVSPLAPLYPYSQAKVRAMTNLRYVAEEYQLPWSWFRVFNAFGEGEPRSRLISATMLALANCQAAELNTPESLRDFIHVSDVARGMLSSLEHQQIGPVNVGCGIGTTVFDLACEIADIVGADRSLVHRSEAPSVDTMPVAIADNSKLRRTGWTPRESQHERLRSLYESLRGA